MPRKKKTEEALPENESPTSPDPSEDLEVLKFQSHLEAFESPVLVSFSDYVYGADGEQYNAAWGNLRIVAGSDLNPPLADDRFLYAVIGAGGGAMMVSFSNIKAITATDECPIRTHIWRAQDEDALGEIEGLED